MSRRNKVSIRRKTMLRREIDELNKFPKSTAYYRNSEQHEEIRELKANNIALKGSSDDTEKSLDHVKLRLDRSGSQVRRLSQQIRGLQESWNVLQDAAEFKVPEPAFGEVSRRTFKSIVNRNHVSEANFAPRCQQHQPQPSIQMKTFFVDSGSSMHMMSKTDLSPEELETVKVPRRPSTVITANGSIDTNEEVTVYVKDLDILVTVQLFEDTPAVLSLGRPWVENG